jgi:hypothetical protein
MDPNFGEIVVNSWTTAGSGLEAHLNSFFCSGFLGDFNHVLVEKYPYKRRPGRREALLEYADALATANAEAAESGEESNRNAANPPLAAPTETKEDKAAPESGSSDSS